jgi:hypothetical protein
MILRANLRPALAQRPVSFLPSRQLRPRSLATVSDAAPKARLSRFEPELKIDYSDFIRRVDLGRRLYVFHEPN